MSDKPLLTIVVPAYNERQRIGATVARIGEFMAAQAYPAELLVVDDGSDDGTAELVESMRDGAGPTISNPFSDRYAETADVNAGWSSAIRQRGSFIVLPPRAAV